jgi:hypothetical protein
MIPRTRARRAEVEIDDFVVKPLNVEQLLSTLLRCPGRAEPIDQG